MLRLPTAVAQSLCGLALFATIGCDHGRNITSSEAVQSRGMIGQTYELQQETAIVRAGYPRLLFRSKRLWLYPPGEVHEYQEVVGRLSVGTRLKIERAGEFNYGLLPAPTMTMSDIPETFAEVLDGSHAGKTVVTNHIGLDAQSDSGTFRPRGDYVIPTRITNR